MIVRAMLAGLLLVAAVVLQTALFPLVPLLDHRPDLLVLVVVGIALRDGSLAGARVGAAAGLLVDLLATAAPLGIALLVYTAVGYAVGSVRPYLAHDSVTAPILVVLTSVLVTTGGYGLAVSLLAEQRVTFVAFMTTTVAVALLTVLLAPPALHLTGRFVQRYPLQGQLGLD